MNPLPIVLNEKELISQLKNPATRERAFGEMVRTHQKMLYYHIRRMLMSHADTDDVLQNTFLKAWRYMDKFRGDAALKTWLYRIATNEALTFLQKRKKMGHTDVEGIQDDIKHSGGQVSTVSGEEIRMKLQRAVLALPERQQMVFNMRYFDEMKYQQISDVLEVTVGALKASYHHAVKKIEAKLAIGS